MTRLTFFLQIIFPVVLGACVSLVLTRDDPFFFGVAAVFLALPVFVTKPHCYLYLFLLTRPLLDLGAGLRVAGLNLAGLASLALIPLCGIFIVADKERFVQLKKDPFLRWFNLFFLFFCMASLFSLVNSSQIRVSAADLLRLFSIWAVVNFVVLFIRSFPERKKSCLLICILSSLIPVGFGLFQVFTRSGVVVEGFNRVYGVFLHPNVFSEYLLLIFFLAIYWMVVEKKAFFRFLLALYAGALLVCIYFTYTRNVWLALFLGVFLLVIVKSGFSRKLLCGGFLLLCGTCLLPFLAGRFEDVLSPSGEQMNSLEWRLELWRRTAEDFLKHPVLGHGIGMYEYNLNVMAHNDYLKTAYEVGAVGLLSYLLLLGFIFFGALGKLYRTRDALESWGYKVLFSVVAGVLLIGFADNVMRSTVIFSYFLILVALLQPEARTPERSPL